MQQYKHRNCKIIGQKGNLVWDFRENKLYFEYFNKKKQEKHRKIFQPTSNNPNDSYIEEIKYFLKCVADKKSTFNNLEQSWKTLKVILENKSVAGNIK